jgi:hypothetical protein
MGSGAGMKGGPYKLLKSIRIWRSNCSDDGAAAIVSYAFLCSVLFIISLLVIMNNEVYLLNIIFFLF